MPLDPPDLVDGATLVVKPSGLLTALVSVFEALWSLAVPVSTVPSQDGLSEADREMLALMAAGATATR